MEEQERYSIVPDPEDLAVMEPEEALPVSEEYASASPRTEEAAEAAAEETAGAPVHEKKEKPLYYSPVATYSMAALLRQMEVTGVTSKGKTAWLLRDAALCDPRIPDLARASLRPDVIEGDEVIASNGRNAVVYNPFDRSVTYCTIYTRDLALAELAHFSSVNYDGISDCLKEAISPEDVMDRRLDLGRKRLSWLDVQASLKELPARSALDAAAHRAGRSLEEIMAHNEGFVTRAGKFLSSGVKKASARVKTAVEGIREANRQRREAALSERAQWHDSPVTQNVNSEIAALAEAVKALQQKLDSRGDVFAVSDDIRQRRQEEQQRAMQARERTKAESRKSSRNGRHR